MARRIALMVLAGLFAAGLLLVLLAPHDDSQSAGDVLHRAVSEPAAPGFHATGGGAAASGSATPAPAHAEPLDLPAAASADAARPAIATHAVSGRVLRASDGSPLEGAMVRAGVLRFSDSTDGSRTITISFQLGGDGAAEGTLSGEGMEAVSLTTTTDAEGRFTLPDVPADVPDLTVESDNAWPTRSTTCPLPATGDDIAGLEIVFDSGFELRGVVRDLRGAPLAGMSVGIGPMEPVLTDAAGSYAFRDVAPEAGTLSVEAWAEGAWYERDTRSALVPAFPSDLVALDFELRGGGALEGTVTDPLGKPVPGAEVRLLAETSRDGGTFSADHQHVQTSADGSYRLDHVPEGTYIVLVSRGPDPLATAMLGVGQMFRTRSLVISATLGGLTASSTPDDETQDVGFAPHIAEGIVVEAGRATQLDVVLDKGATIEGRVLAADGAPVVGAELMLQRLLRWPVPAHTPPMTRFDSDTVLDINTGSHGEAGEAGAAGQSARAAHAGLAAQSTLSAVEQRAVTDDDGRYHMERVSSGEKHLQAADAEQRCAPAGVTLEVRGTESYPHVDFVLPLGLSVRGRVTDPSGAPLEGVSASVKPAGIVVFDGKGARLTDADGTFELPGLPAMSHTLFLSLTGYGPLYVDVVPGAPPGTWVLKPAPMLHGLVLDAQSGQSIQRYALRVEGEQVTSETVVQDHADGRFTWETDDAAPCTVIVTAPGYAPQTLRGVNAATTSEASPLTIRLQPTP